MSNTRIYKDVHYGWTAITLLPVPQLSDKTYLEVVTMKRSSGALCTSCLIQKESTEGSLSHVMYKDFRKTIYQNKVRCTEKAVREQHELALQNIATTISEAVVHYSKGE